MKKYYMILLFSLLIIISCKPDIKFSSGKEVVNAMHEKYAGKWYKNFTFSQGVEQFKNDSLITKEVWHKAYKAPSKLIIKFKNYGSGAGYLFSGDSLHIFAHHNLAASREHVNFLMTLGFGVYNQPVEKTFESLGKVNFDLEKVMETSIDGNSAYVVGVTNLGEKKNHFYIDAEKLIFLKAVTFNGNNRREVLYQDYKEEDGNIVAAKVKFFTNGILEMTENHYNMEFPETLPDSIFNKDKFLKARW